MKFDYPVRVRQVARRTAMAYLALGALWILLSDRAVGLLTADPVLIERISMAKGWLFVAVTASLLYLALRKQLGRVEAEAAARQQAAATLAELEERQRLFIAHAPAALAMFDREMRYLAASRRWMTSFKVAGQELVGRSHYEVFPHLLEHVKEAHRRGLAGEVVTAKADPYRRDDGTVQWLQWEVRPWRDAQGAVGGIMIFTEDITERIGSEAALRESEERYRLLAENVGDVVWVLDAITLRFEYVSPSIEKLRGFTVAEVMATSCLEGMEPKSVALLEATLPGRIEAFRAGDPAAVTQTHEIRQSHRDGRWVWVEVVTTLVRATGGGLRIVGVSRSIEARKRVETELRESEARFRELAETINEVFWITDPEKQRVLYVSPAYEKIWGVPCASVYADPASWLAAIHAEDRARVAAAARTRQHTGEYDETYRIVRPGGEIRWVHDRAFPVRDESGRVVRIAGVAEDVTEKRRIETQFLRAQRLEAVGALAGGVAHDLNNILTPVLMAAGVLKGESEQAGNRELIAMIEQSTRRGADIIRQLLTFSRGIEGERIVLQPRHLIREMTAIVRETFPREISLHVDVAADLWTVEANSTQIHQVLMNLCVNARDAMAEGGRLTIEARNLEVRSEQPLAETELKPGPHVVLAVTDTGAGIAPELVTRIFEPFFTTKEQGKGTGLGLSTVLGIVRSHGGNVAVYSEPGRGSVFKVYLPAKPGGGLVAGVEVAPAAGGRGELVLVVDDENTIRNAMRHVLEKGGYRVLVARNGEEALSMALQQGGALRAVVTDVMMPVMDGFALTRALRSLDPVLAVVASSGLEQEEKRREFAALGVHEVVAKPCAPEELLAAVRRALDARVGGG